MKRKAKRKVKRLPRVPAWVPYVQELVRATVALELRTQHGDLVRWLQALPDIAGVDRAVRASVGSMLLVHELVMKQKVGKVHDRISEGNERMRQMELQLGTLKGKLTAMHALLLELGKPPFVVSAGERIDRDVLDSVQRPGDVTFVLPGGVPLEAARVEISDKRMTATEVNEFWRDEHGR